MSTILDTPDFFNAVIHGVKHQIHPFHKPISEAYFSWVNECMGGVTGYINYYLGEEECNQAEEVRRIRKFLDRCRPYLTDLQLYAVCRYLMVHKGEIKRELEFKPVF